jgi:hypothetical protein
MSAALQGAAHARSEGAINPNRASDSGAGATNRVVRSYSSHTHTDRSSGGDTNGSNLHSGFEAMVLRRITVTSDRHRQT